VSVAVPTERHLDVALPFLKAGVPVLVEKPMARSVEEADAMIAAATGSGAALAVGHTERFNPAVDAARPMLHDPRFIEVHRLGTFPERSLDIDVVFDLMIHDLDVVLSIVRSDVESIEAVGVPVLTPRVDIANVRLRFANGCIANLTASRISRDRVRKIRFFQPAAYVSIDYAAQKLEVYRLVKGDGPMPSIQGGDMPVANEEPLKRELADFIDAVVNRRAPYVDGAQGRRALDLATKIVNAM
jgi:predicted dehydrogenase